MGALDGSVPTLANRPWLSRRFVLSLIVFSAINAAGLWWIHDTIRPRAAAPRVSRVHPTGVASPRERISITFSADVAPHGGPLRTDPSSLIRIVPPVHGRACWTAPNQLAFEPSSPLPLGQEFSVLVSRDIGRPGLPLEGPSRFSFSTEPLRVVSVAQTGLGRRVSPLGGDDPEGTARLRLRFNAEVDPGLLGPHLQALDRADRPLSYEVLTTKRSEEVDIRASGIASRITVVFGPAPAGKGGLGAGIHRESRFTVELTRALKVTEARGGRISIGHPSLEVYFNNAVDGDGASGQRKLEDCFSVEPAVSFTATAHGSKVELDGEFQPGSHYRLTVRKGLRGGTESLLDDDAVMDVYFPDREPSISFRGDGGFLSSEGALGLVLSTVNVNAVRVRVLRVHENNLVHFLQEGWPRPTFTRALAPRLYRTPPGVNQVRELVLDLQDLAGPDPRGVWFIEAQSAEDDEDDLHGWSGWAQARKLICVSDIGISLKESQDGSLRVWTTALRTGEPLAGVHVTLRSATNQLVAEGYTDGVGLVSVKEYPLEDGPPRIVLASRHGDFAYLEVEGSRLSRADFDVGGRPHLRTGYEAFVFTDRGVYRPGDDVRVKAIVRGRDGGLPGKFPLEVETLRPNRKRLRADMVALGDEGTLETAIRLSESAATGLYRVRIRLPGDAESSRDELGVAAFRVEDYMPARLRVEVALAGDEKADGRDEPSGARAERRLLPGETVELAVKGAYLFGAPAGGCAVEASWSLHPVPVEIRGWKGFRFGELSPERSHPAHDAEPAVLDAAGEARFRFEVPRVETASALRLRFTAAVRDVAGRTVSGELMLPVDPAPRYLGLRAVAADPGAKGIVAGEPARFECVAVRPDGSLADLDAAEAVVWAVEWTSVLKKNRGAYRYESREELREVARRRVVLPGGRGGFELQFDRPGTYRIRLKDPASMAAAELRVHASGPGWRYTDVSLDHPGRLDITFARAAYQPGETARVVVRAPFPGTLLLTTETEVVETVRVLRMPAGLLEVDVPIPAAATQTIYVGGSLVRGMAAGPSYLPYRAHGIAPVPLDLNARRLTVTVESAPEWRPGARGAVRVLVSGEDGAPVPGALVAVAAVDEGVLSLTRHATPEPFEFFYGKRAHGVETADSFAALLPEVPFLRERARPAGDAAGAEEAAEAVRLSPINARRVKTVSIVSGPLMTGEDGGVVVELELPQFTGELRCYAVAAAGNRFGSAHRSMTVRGPLFFELGLPRFVAPGDSFFAPVALFNRTTRAGRAAFEWTLDGMLEGLAPPPAGLAFAALKEGGLDVDAGGSARFLHPLRAADRAGKAIVRLDASLGADTYGEAIELPVRPAAPRCELAESGAVTADRPAEIVPSSSYLPGSVRYRLVLSGLPEVELAGSLRYLLDFPHGCLEQTTSRAFPLLYLRDLADLAGAGYGPEERGSGGSPAAAAGAGGAIDATDDYVLAAIERIVEMQGQGGWFGWWPGTGHGWPWGTVYSAHFLLEARAAGYPVPGPELDLVLRYIVEDVIKPRPPTPDWTYASHVLERAYGLYVLALAKRPDRPSMDSLRREMAEALRAGEAGLYSASVRGFLAGAYLLAADAATARALLGDSLPAPSTVRDSGHALRSPAREAAILLSAVLEVDPTSPMLLQLVERLRGYRAGGRWGTTQENAFALLALGKYARHRAGTAQDFRAKVTVQGGAPIDVGPGEPRALEGDSLDGPIRITLEGPGTLFYTFLVAGVPKDGEVREVDEGLRVRRRFLDRRLAPLDLAGIPFGEPVVVELALEAEAPFDNVVVTDMLPAGLEIENPELGGAAFPQLEAEVLATQHVSRRDDRLVAFFNLSTKTKGVYYYAARAVTRGEFRLPPVQAEALYSPGTRSVSGAGTAVVR